MSELAELLRHDSTALTFAQRASSLSLRVHHAFESSQAHARKWAIIICCPLVNSSDVHSRKTSGLNGEIPSRRDAISPVLPRTFYAAELTASRRIVKNGVDLAPSRGIIINAKIIISDR